MPPRAAWALMVAALLLIAPLARAASPLGPSDQSSRTRMITGNDAAALREIVMETTLQRLRGPQAGVPPVASPRGVSGGAGAARPLPQVSPTEIRLEAGQQTPVSLPGVLRFVVVNPDIAFAERVGTDTLRISGVKPGTTFLHYWDRAGRHTLRVSATAPTFGFVPPAPTEEVGLPGLQPLSSVKVLLANGVTHLNISSPFAANELSDSRFFQDVDVWGGTPFGEMALRARLQGRHDPSREVQELTRFIGSLQNDPYGFELNVGDKDLDWSALTLPRQHLQGVYWRQEVAQTPWSYEVLTGVKNQGLYGDEIINGVPPTPQLLGGRVKLWPMTHLGLTSAYVYAKDAGESEISRDTFAVGTDLDFGRFRWESEWAQGDHDQAWETALSVNPWQWWQLRGKFIRHEPEFQIPSGNVERRGQRGLFLTTNVRPNSWWSLWGSYDAYADRLFGNEAERDQLNTDLRASTRLSLPGRASLSGSYFNRDRGGSRFPTLTEGGLLLLSLPWHWGRVSFDGFTTLSANSLRSITTPASDFDQAELGVGLNTQLTSGLRLLLMEAWTRRKERVSSAKFFPRRFRTGLFHTAKLGRLPATLSSGIEYEDRTEEPTAFFSGEDSLSGSVELRVQPSSDRWWFVRGVTTNFRGPSIRQSERTRSELFFGMTYLWDTGVSVPRPAIYGAVVGAVFQDLNGDGTADPGESGLAGVHIVLDDGRTALTDAAGRFAFPRVRGPRAVVTLASADVPPGALLSNANPQEVAIRHRETAQVPFGLVIEVEVYGAIFNDVDFDGQFTEADVPMGQQRLRVGDHLGAFSDPAGRYRVSGLSAGTYALRVEPAFVPPGFSLGPGIPREVELPEGRRVQVDIPLRAARTATGIVFLDRNGNGRQDPRDEPGLERVGVLLDGQRTVTGPDGLYVFRDLPAGIFRIRLDRTGLPKGAAATTDGERFVRLKAEPATMTRQDFGVQFPAP